MINFFKTDSYLLFLNFVIILLFIGFIILLINNIKMSNKYKKFMKKLGNGKNLEEDLENFMYKVERVEKQNAEITNFCNNLEEDLSKCIQKIGIVRYSAFKDTGSDLSFALALLDEKNNGIVLNGIYSREMSNIYAKPVKNGSSSYTLSNEELEAIDKAINSNNIYKEKII
ncbi:MAG: DUF4446 family protein [Clostridia bacterium]|nr:DUF4446 family protein [Clostridia bacterium]